MAGPSIGSTQLASGNSDLSHRTEEQTSALQQTARAARSSRSVGIFQLTAVSMPTTGRRIHRCVEDTWRDRPDVAEVKLDGPGPKPACGKQLEASAP